MFEDSKKEYVRTVPLNSLSSERKGLSILLQKGLGLGACYLTCATIRFLMFIAEYDNSTFIVN
jgi:hypothetical protein